MFVQSDLPAPMRIVTPWYVSYEMPGWRRAVRDIALQLVQRYGYDSTSYFALSQEKQLFVSSDGQSMISYVEQGGSLLVLGDPIGTEQSLVLALREFLEFCQRKGKVAAFW